jgi:diguanylate cyclase (GGDEF)-like protein/PAS domain S-box-containing protein
VALLVGLQLLLVASVLAGLYFSGQHLRGVALDHMRSHAQVQTHNLEDSLTQSFNLLDMHLRALVVEHPEIQYAEQGVAPRDLEKALTALQDKLPYVRSLSVLERSGRVLASTQAANIGQQPGLEPLLPRVAPHTPGVLRFGAPWRGRDFADGSPWPATPGPGEVPDARDAGFFPITLVLPEAPQWTIVVAINSDYFINQALNHEVSPALRHQLYADNGTLLLSTAEDDLPGSVLDGARLAAVLERQVGVAQWPGPRGDAWLVAFRASRNYPWFVQSQASSTQVLQAWRRDMRQLALLAGLTLLLVLLTTGALTWRVRRSLQREERRLEANRLAASVFAHSSDFIVITDRQGRIVTVNPAFERGTGFSAAEATGCLPGHLSPTHPVPAHFDAMWAAMAAEGAWQGEVIDWRKDGTPLTGWLTVNAIRDSAGRVVNYVGVLHDLSRLRADEATIRKLSLAVEQSPTSILITSTAPAIEYANPHFLYTTGYTLAEVLGANPRLLQSGQTSPATYQAMWAQLRAGKVWQGEFVNRRKSGALYTESATIAPLVDDQGQITHYLGIKQDITAAKEAEKALRLAASVVANTHEGVMVCDAMQRIIEVNPAFTRITGYPASEALGRKPSLLSSGRRSREQYPAMWQALHQHGHWQGEFWNRHKNGSLYAAASAINALRDADGQVTHYVSVFSDVTERKHQQEQLERLAHFDPLTGLPNRALLADRLQQGLARAQRARQGLAVCFMDLDGFKAVNDMHGHDAGDDLLAEVARRLQGGIRAGDTAARLGGDEFVLLLGGLRHPRECEDTARRVLHAVALPIEVEGHTVHVTGSMGISVFPRDGSDAEQLLRQADQAMYQAKQRGRNRYVLYAPGMAETGPGAA